MSAPVSASAPVGVSASAMQAPQEMSLSAAPQEMSLSALDTVLQRLQKMEIDNAVLRGKIAHLEARKYEAVVASTVFADEEDEEDEEDEDSD